MESHVCVIDQEALFGTTVVPPHTLCRCIEICKGAVYILHWGELCLTVRFFADPTPISLDRPLHWTTSKEYATIEDALPDLVKYIHATDETDHVTLPPRKMYITTEGMGDDNRTTPSGIKWDRVTELLETDRLDLLGAEYPAIYAKHYLFPLAVVNAKERKRELYQASLSAVEPTSHRKIPHQRLIRGEEDEAATDFIDVWTSDAALVHEHASPR